MSDRPTRKEAAPENVQAFDVRTGKPRWKFNPIPRPGEVGNETWENDSWSYTGEANLWSLISADEDQGLAYLPLTRPTNDMFGGHRLGDNSSPTRSCASGVSPANGWHYQIIHHDLWDYDLPTAPILADITVEENRSKRSCSSRSRRSRSSSIAHRHTGMADRRAAGSSSDARGARRETQPFPTKPPAFDRQG